MRPTEAGVGFTAEVRGGPRRGGWSGPRAGADTDTPALAHSPTLFLVAPVAPILSVHTLASALAWIEAALVIFLVIFIFIVVRVALRRRGHYDPTARIPLEDDRVMTPREEPAGGRRRRGTTGASPGDGS